LYLEKTQYPDPSAEDHSYDDEFIFVSNHLIALSVMITKSELDRLFREYPSYSIEPSAHGLFADDKQTTFRVDGIEPPPYSLEISDDALMNEVGTGFPPSPSESHVVLKVSGSGTRTTERFLVIGDWDLSWHYDCSNLGDKDNFVVLSKETDGSLSANLPVNQVGMSGSGVEHYHDYTSGPLYLQIITECSWQVSAWQLP